MESGCGSRGVCNICPIISRRSIGFTARLKRVCGPGTMSSGRIGRWRSRLQVHRQTLQVTQVCSSECKEMVSLQKEIYICAVPGGVLCLSRGEGKGAINPKERKYILHVCPTGTDPARQRKALSGSVSTPMPARHRAISVPVFSGQASSSPWPQLRHSMEMQMVCGSGTACGRCPWTTGHGTPIPDSAGWQRTCAPPSPFCVCGHLLSAPWQSAGRCPEPEPGVVRCRGREAWQDRNTRFSSPCARGGCRLGQSLGGRSLPPARCRACLGRCQAGRRGGAVSSVD